MKATQAAMPKAIKARSGISATSRKVRLIGPCISAASLKRAYLDASEKSCRKWKSKIDSELEYWRQELKRKGEQLAALKRRRVAKSTLEKVRRQRSFGAIHIDIRECLQRIRLLTVSGTENDSCLMQIKEDQLRENHKQRICIGAQKTRARVASGL